jgi:hypothetical protein
LRQQSDYKLLHLSMDQHGGIVLLAASGTRRQRSRRAAHVHLHLVNADSRQGMRDELHMVMLVHVRVTMGCTWCSYYELHSVSRWPCFTTMLCEPLLLQLDGSKPAGRKPGGGVTVVTGN